MANFAYYIIAAPEGFVAPETLTCSVQLEPGGRWHTYTTTASPDAEGAHTFKLVAEDDTP